MKIAIGSDALGYQLKQILIDFLKSQKDILIDVIDKGVIQNEDVDYPLIAEKVAMSVRDGEAERGILICGTGIGMAMTANKIPGIRAAQAHDTYSAMRARMSNNAQIITLGALVIGTELAREIIGVWLRSEFQGGRSSPKVDLINQIDQRYRNE